MSHHRHLNKRILTWAVVLCCQLAIMPQLWAQSSTDAFYIYQNDGHFDGFFYDEVQCIQYSKTDTLGVEHTDYVSQEIVTADSTYRFMLTAIDSVGFVQPEIIYNPKLRDMISEGMDKALFGWDRSSSTINFFEDALTEANKPQVGDVLLYNAEEIFVGKVTSVSSDGFWFYTVETEPVSDVRDVYQQFITVEEYSHDRNGRLAGRRVAGMPELTKGSFARPRRASGEFSGDIFSFNFSGHIPLYDDTSIDVDIEGGVNVKANWHLPLIGSSYICITPTLSAGLGLGISVNGTISEPMEGGLSENATIPLPATVPMFELVLAPDCFLRGNVTANAKIATPKVKGKVWSKIEFIDYWPYIEMGFGNPPGTTDEEAAAEEEADYYDNVSSATYEFSGFVQTGMQFPLKLRTNKWLSKVLDCELGTTMYLGPKISATLSLDLENRFVGDDSFYGNYKNSKVTLSMLDADYETKATIKSFWGDPKEQTLADGTFNILPSVDLFLFPDFENWTETDEEISVTPTRNILLPSRVGIRLYSEDKFTGNLTHIDDYWHEDVDNARYNKYYQLYGPWMNGTAKLSMSKKDLSAGTKYKAYPIFSFFGATIQGNQVYDFEIKPKAYFTDIPDDPIVFSPNGETKTLCSIAGTLDGVTIEIYNRPLDAEFKVSGHIVTMTLPKKYGFSNVEGGIILVATDKNTNFTLSNADIPILQKPTYEVKDVLVSGPGIDWRDESDRTEYEAFYGEFSLGATSIRDGKLAASSSYSSTVKGKKWSVDLSVNFIDADANEDKRWGNGSWLSTYVYEYSKEIQTDEGIEHIWVERSEIYELSLVPDEQAYAQELVDFTGRGTKRTIERYQGEIISDATDSDTARDYTQLVTR